MNNFEIEAAVNEILKIERESIKKRKDAVSGTSTILGKNRADIDVVNKILSMLEVGGIGNED